MNIRLPKPERSSCGGERTSRIPNRDARGRRLALNQLACSSSPSGGAIRQRPTGEGAGWRHARARALPNCGRPVPVEIFFSREFAFIAENSCDWRRPRRADGPALPAPKHREGPTSSDLARTTDPATLDPALLLTQEDDMLFPLLYLPLLDLTNGTQLVPCAARCLRAGLPISAFLLCSCGRT